LTGVSALEQEQQMAKSSDAFKTIGEVSDDLDVPKHVLRFWEGKFPQLKPMKRGGGRRFYRPEDVVLLKGIHHLLHAAGYTIKGVQRILREHGVDAVKTAVDGSQAAGATSAAPAKAAKRGAAKAVTIPAALRTELEALSAELVALLAIARGEVPGKALAGRPAGRKAR
jgi:DNA-binding transcriptional MerR regulator